MSQYREFAENYAEAARKEIMAKLVCAQSILKEMALEDINDTEAIEKFQSYVVTMETCARSLGATAGDIEACRVRATRDAAGTVYYRLQKRWSDSLGATA